MFKKTIIIFYKIFFIGLIVQFFLQTFVTYKLGLQQDRMQYIRLWKEGIIALLAILTLWWIIWKNKRKQLIITPTIGRWTVGLLLVVGLTVVIHIILLQQPLTTYILAFKYDFFGFFILLIWFHSSGFLDKKDRNKLIERYGYIIKRCLRLALIRYFIIFIKPGTLKLFGYDNFMYEGSVGTQPPAAYYTLINHGITRNQFLFERPISRWFFLIAFFPLFYTLFLHKQNFRTTRWRRSIYGINIAITFSRAARGAWIIQLIIVGLIIYQKNLKTFLRKILLPVWLGIVLIGGFGYKHIIQRDYSTNGHIEMLRNGTKLFAKSPLIGHGGGRAGPASHREWGPKFNPENQFLQIMIEFGLLGFLWWFLLYLTLNFIGLNKIIQFQKYSLKSLEQQKNTLLIAAMSIGMLGLSAEGMLLHSFSDRMTVYPLMLLFGIIWMQYLLLNKKFV